MRQNEIFPTYLKAYKMSLHRINSILDPPPSPVIKPQQAPTHTLASDQFQLESTFLELDSDNLMQGYVEEEIQTEDSQASCMVEQRSEEFGVGKRSYKDFLGFKKNTPCLSSIKMMLSLVKPKQIKMQNKPRKRVNI